MAIWESVKEKSLAVWQSNRTADVIDFGAGSGLVGAAMYTHIENAIHLLMGLAGLAIILIRLRWYWIHRNKKPADDGSF